MARRLDSAEALRLREALLFAAQRREPEAVFDADAARTRLRRGEADGADSAAPDLIILVLRVHLEQLLVVFEVVQLLPHVDRRALRVDVLR